MVQEMLSPRTIPETCLPIWRSSYRPPRHQRELAGFLDDGKAAAGEIDMPAIDALDLLPRLGLDIAQPQFLRQLTGDAHKLSPTQDAEQIGAINVLVLIWMGFK